MIGMQESKKEDQPRHPQGSVANFGVWLDQSSGDGFQIGIQALFSISILFLSPPGCQFSSSWATESPFLF